MQWSFAFFKCFLKISIQVRLDLPGGPYDLKELGRLLPLVLLVMLAYVLLDHLLATLCGMDLIYLIRNIRGWGVGGVGGGGGEYYYFS